MVVFLAQAEIICDYIQWAAQTGLKFQQGLEFWSCNRLL
jgi:hypothetical protein